MKKEALFREMLHGANRLANETAIGSSFMNADFAKFLVGGGLVKHEGGKLLAKDKLLYGYGSIPKFVQNATQKVVDWGYNSRSPEIKQKLQSANNIWDKVSMTQAGLMFADLGADIISPQKGAKPMANNAPNMAKKNQSMLQQSMSNARQLPTDANNFQNTIQQPEQFRFNMQKDSSSDTFRPLGQKEMWTAIGKLIDYQKEFMLDDVKSVQLMVNRVVRQDSWVLEDGEGNIKGFINGGHRGLPVHAPGAYYIRFVWVNPAFKGQGVAATLVQKLVGMKVAKRQINEKLGVWMQINPTNTAMQKAATKMGFKHVTDWDLSGKICQIWLK